VIAVVRADSAGRQRMFLACTLGALLGAIELARHYPDFCAGHAIALSLSICAALAAVRFMLRRVAAPSLICDGHWLAYQSWLLGMLIDLKELAEVHVPEVARDGPLAEITLCTRQRELYRLDLRRWRREDVRGLLSALVESHPGMKMDRDIRAWLRQAALIR